MTRFEVVSEYTVYEVMQLDEFLKLYVACRYHVQQLARKRNAFGRFLHSREAAEFFSIKTLGGLFFARPFGGTREGMFILTEAA